MKKHEAAPGIDDDLFEVIWTEDFILEGSSITIPVVHDLMIWDYQPFYKSLESSMDPYFRSKGFFMVDGFRLLFEGVRSFDYGAFNVEEIDGKVKVKENFYSRGPFPIVEGPVNTYTGLTDFEPGIEFSYIEPCDDISWEIKAQRLFLLEPDEPWEMFDEDRHERYPLEKYKRPSVFSRIKSVFGWN